MPFYDVQLNEILADNVADFYDRQVVYPGPHLTPFVSNYTILTNKKIGDRSGWLILPDTRSYLICHECVCDGNVSWTIVFVGPRSRAIEIKRANRKRTVIVAFQPVGPYSLIQIPLTEFTDQAVDLSLIWKYKYKAEDLKCALLSCDRDLDLIKAIELFLIENLKAVRPVQNTVRAIDSMISSGCGTLKIRDLSRKLGFSERHILEITKNHLGLSAKKMIKVNRLLKALAVLDETDYNANWTQIAYKAGFYDQSHLIDDFLQLLHCTPSELLKKISR